MIAWLQQKLASGDAFTIDMHGRNGSKDSAASLLAVDAKGIVVQLTIDGTLSILAVPWTRINGIVVTDLP